jgi:hypothetical protein
VNKRLLVFGRSPVKTDRLYPHSRLYHLRPCGVGTPEVESLTSYVSRLAEAHCLSVANLFGLEIAPAIKNPYVNSLLSGKNRSSLLASRFGTTVRAINGTGSTAEEWVEALESLTLRTDLGRLTMLRWGKALPHKSLSRKTRAWCPACLEESKAGEQTVYERLAWTLQVVTACVRHRRSLCAECPHCGRQNPPLTSKTRPGRCSVCGQWLGGRQANDTTETITEEEYKWQSWVLSQLGKLLSKANDDSRPLDKAAVSRSITSCVKKHAGGNHREMARILGTSKGRIRLWAQGQNLPVLGALLRFCYGIGETLVGMLTGTAAREKKSTTARAQRHKVLKKGRPRGWSRLDLEATRQALEHSIKKEFPPPSLKTISLRLGRTANTLRYQFPKLCSLIVKKFRQHSKLSRKGFYRTIEQALRKALKSARPAPTLEDLVREFGCHRSVFTSNFPRLCEALRRRNEEDRKNELAEIEGLLHAATAEIPPRSFKEFCGRTGRSDQSLRETFPELCARISARYASYRSECNRLKREGLAQYVRDVAYALYGEGMYPSVRNVQSRITSFSVRSSKIALSVLREVRLEVQLSAVKAA